MLQLQTCFREVATSTHALYAPLVHSITVPSPFRCKRSTKSVSALLVPLTAPCCLPDHPEQHLLAPGLAADDLLEDRGFRVPQPGSQESRPYAWGLV